MGEDGSYRLDGLAMSASRSKASILLLGAGRPRGEEVPLQAEKTSEFTFGTPGGSADGARLVVRVTAGGRPLRGVLVTVSVGDEHRLARSDAEGRADFEGLDEGAVRPEVWLGDPGLVDDFAPRAWPGTSVERDARIRVGCGHDEGADPEA